MIDLARLSALLDPPPFASPPPKRYGRTSANLESVEIGGNGERAEIVFCAPAAAAGLDRIHVLNGEFRRSTTLVRFQIGERVLFDGDPIPTEMFNEHLEMGFDEALAAVATPGTVIRLTFENYTRRPARLAPKELVAIWVLDVSCPSSS